MTIMLLVWMAGTGSASAQRQAPPHIAATLLAETMTPAAGTSTTLAIAMRPAPGWHGYWSNPGDAGLGMAAEWSVPAGGAVGPLRYPAPSRLLLAGLMNHVFEGPYALLADFEVPAGLAAGIRLPVTVDARWLACTDKLCVPEQARLTMTLTVGAGAVLPGDRRRFDAWRAALPKPLGAPATYAVSDGRLRIAIPYPAAAPIAGPWFYAAQRDAVVHAEPQRVERSGDRIVIATRAAAGFAGGPLPGVLSVTPNLALTVVARPGAVPETGPDIGKATVATFLLALGGAVLGGLILNIMPCVFPILSLKAIALARSGGDAAAARREAVGYAGGTVLSCAALGLVILALRAAGRSVGWAFQLQDNRVLALLLVLAVAITASLAGLFTLPTVAGGRAGAGVRGAFLTGMLAAFVATPCTGPFMAAAMGAALLLPWPAALVLFAGLGLGLALPFVLIAFVPALQRRLPKPGAWMERVQRLLAIPMAMTALGLVWLFWRQQGSPGLIMAGAIVLATLVLCARAGQRQRAGSQTGVPSLIGALALLIAAPTAASWLHARQDGRAANGMAFDEGRLAALRGAGRPVFLYFTADWCLTCKVNEANAIADPRVGTHFAKSGIAVMVGDWTRGDPAITRFLEAHGRSGVPVYMFYPVGGGEPRILPQILTPAALLALR